LRFAGELHTVSLGFCGLEAAHLADFIPEIIRGQDIAQLYLENNKLDCLPDNFEELREAHRLRTIVLESNMLTQVPRVLLDCDGLVLLNLSRNRLTSIPLGLCELEHLQCLELSHNCLTDLPGPGFGSMKNLQVLKLDHNLLTSIPEDLGTNNSSLTVLDLSRNAHYNRGLPGAMLGLRDQLEELVLHGTGIMSSLPRRFLKATAADLIDLMAGTTAEGVLARIEESKNDRSASTGVCEREAAVRDEEKRLRDHTSPADRIPRRRNNSS
jgi:hypothetical protein